MHELLPTPSSSKSGACRIRKHRQARLAAVRVVAAFCALVLLITACADRDRPSLVATDVLQTPTPPAAGDDAVVEPTVEAAAADGGSSEAAAFPTPTSLPQVPSAAPNPLACLSTRQRLGQTLMPLVEQWELEAVAPLAAAGEVGGITLLGTSDEGLADALASMQDGALIALHIGSDEEGGDVQRLRNLLGPLPSAQAMAAMPTADVAKLMEDYGTKLRDLGVTMNFAPVVDVGGGPGIGSRSFSSDPIVVSEYGLAVLDGLGRAGIIGVLKHFPGHGRASADSHDSLPTTPPIAELREVDLLPFVALLDSAPAIMVGHLSVPGLSDETPTSLSARTINGLLRAELGYDGLVITDALNMGAITPGRTVTQAALEALSAGADVAMINGLADVTPVLDGLVAAIDAGILSAARVDEATMRVLASKGLTDFCQNQ